MSWWKELGAPRQARRIRATYKRPHGVRHSIAAYDIGADKLYGHITTRKTRVEPRVLSLHPVAACPRRSAAGLMAKPIEAQSRALGYFTSAGTDHPDHATQAHLIRRNIAWRNRNP